MERKLYKTKLCILYQRGRCLRQSCSFAHGEAELRRFTSSVNDRRDYRDNDLRERLDKRHSPHLRYSPGRDTRSRRTFRGHQKQVSYDRGYSLSRSPEKRSERRPRKKQHLDGQSDISGSVKISDGSEDRMRDGKAASNDVTDALEDQLKQAQLDIDMLEDHKGQLEIFLEEKVQEADSLTTRINELESQLDKEQEDCRRITSKIKKFVKAHNRYSHAQDELKRAQARFQRLGDQLGFDASRSGGNEEDSSVNIVSDGEPNGANQLSPRNELQNYVSPNDQKLQVNQGISEEGKPVNMNKREGFSVGTTKLEKLTRWDGSTIHSGNNSKKVEVANKVPIGKNNHKPPANEEKHKQEKHGSSSIIASFNKVKGMESGHLLPSTSMAAHAVDELIEAIEMEETASALENGTVNGKPGLPYLPPPPPTLPQNCYHQYKGDDEDVDVEVLDAETGDVDITN